MMQPLAPGLCDEKSLDAISNGALAPSAKGSTFVTQEHQSFSSLSYTIREQLAHERIDSGSAGLPIVFFLGAAHDFYSWRSA